jgi:hypothetical protein
MEDVTLWICERLRDPLAHQHLGWELDSEKDAAAHHCPLHRDQKIAVQWCETPASWNEIPAPYCEVVG